MSIYKTRIVLNKGLSTQYIFDRGFGIDPAPWGKRLNELNRAYKHGSAITGDEMVEARPLRIWGTLVRSNPKAYQDELDLMEAACYRNDLTLHAYEWWPDRFLRVDLKNFSRENYPTLQAGPIDILFRVTDPFWYSDTKSALTKNNISAGAILINNTGKIEVSPTIHVRVVSGEVTSVRMTNNSDNGRELIYGNPAPGVAPVRTMTAGRGFRVRCATGELHRWSGAAYFEDLAGLYTGSTFYRLQPGQNQIILTLVGTAPYFVNTTHYWRAKWLG